MPKHAYIYHRIYNSVACYTSFTKKKEVMQFNICTFHVSVIPI